MPGGVRDGLLPHQVKVKGWLVATSRLSLGKGSNKCLCSEKVRDACSKCLDERWPERAVCIAISRPVLHQLSQNQNLLLRLHHLRSVIVGSHLVISDRAASATRLVASFCSMAEDVRDGIPENHHDQSGL